MEETRWWSRLLLISAAISVVLLVSGPLGYKFELAPLGPSLSSLALALLGGALVLIVSLIMAGVAHARGLVRNRNFVLIAVALSALPVLVMGPQLAKAFSVPPIHDITTDTDDPPKYEVVVGLRTEAPNSLEYGAGMTPEELAELQKAAYPNVKPLTTDMSVADAVARAEAVLASQGLEVVNVSVEDGRVEAVATTFWFGFKDDVVVRVRESNGGTVVDVRSVSRVGQSDVGANAARIEKFLGAF